MQGLIENVVTGFEWGYLALFFIIFAVSLRASLKPTPFNATRDIISLVVSLVAATAYLIIQGVMVNTTVALAAIVIAAILGLLLGNMSQISRVEDTVVLKRIMIAPNLLMLAFLASIFFNFFGGKNLMSFGALLVMATFALYLGTAVTEIFRGMRESS